MPAMLARLRPVLGALISLSCAGCAGSLRHSGAEIASGAIEASVEGSEDPVTRDALAGVMEDIRIRQALGSLSREVAAEALAGLTDQRSINAMEIVAQRLTLAIGEALSQSLEREIGPAVQRLVAASLSDALGSEMERRMEAISGAATRGALDAMQESFASANFDHASTPLGALARQMSKEATLGFQDAVRIESNRHEVNPRKNGEVLAALGETADATLDATPWLLWALVALVLASLGGGAYVLIRLERGQRELRAVSDALSRLDDSSTGSQVRAEVARALRQM